MNDTSIKPIGSVQQSENSALTRVITPAQTEQPPAQPRQSVTSQSKVQIKPAEIGTLANVSIHFRVNDETNDVTVFLVDRQSRKVLRSIPASELQKLQIGDLLKLTV